MRKSNNKYYNKVLKLIDIAIHDHYSLFPMLKPIDYLEWCMKFKKISDHEYRELCNTILEYQKLYDC